MTARNRHLRRGDHKSAVAQVVTGLDEPLAIGAVDRTEDAPRGGEIHDRRSPSLLAEQALRERAAEIITRDAHDVDQISRSFEIHRRDVARIGHDADGGDQQRAGDWP
jgi:hypothetical protein